MPCHGAPIQVLGQVAHPGTLTCTPSLTVMQAIFLSGGLTVLAWRIHLTRGSRRFTLDRKHGQDVRLADWDQILVDAREY
jgi:protein involved in polysaccharide export with SLBB domain